MLDLQRNLLTAVLAVAIGVLVLAGAGLALLLGRPDVADIEPSGGRAPEEVVVDVPQTGLEAFENYSTIIERPVFFSDRRLPVVEAPGEEIEFAEQQQAGETEEPVSELQATVAGIVITPEMKLAMVADSQAGKTLLLREGMSLEGEQAAWKLDSIEARQVRFVSVDGREHDLELKVNTSGLTAPMISGQSSRAGGETPQTGEEADARQEASEEARTRAEEIRRRVAERRAELRAEAERRAQQGQD